MSPVLWALLGLVLLLVLFLIVQYNKLVGMRLRIGESWSNVDTELKRRHDLIPNLVAVVRGYAAHERDLLETLTRLRAQALSQGDNAARRSAERDLSLQLGRLFAVAENYPRLRASENFLHLQRELTTTEDRIQASRRFYNGNVRDYNNQVQQFPSNLVANTFGFRAHDYFELPDASHRAAPLIDMGSR